MAASAGDAERAKALARSIDEPYQRVQCLAHAAEAMIHAGLPGEAMALADEVETTARSIVNAESQAETLTILATTMVEANDLDRAAAFAAQLDTYAHLI